LYLHIHGPAPVVVLNDELDDVLAHHAGATHCRQREWQCFACGTWLAHLYEDMQLLFKSYTLLLCY
jgi:hypothetical protein